MTTEQTLAFAILGATLVLFIWARWRYDVVAVLALLAVVFTGLVPPAEALVGFSHPAVITVAAVLIISRGLQNAGLVDLVVKAIAPLRGRENMQIAAQCVVIAVLSSFMNNVGALALMLPVAMRNAYRDGYPPAKSLMPLAFASLLGGLTTLIGTPPNIIIASFRARELGQPFGMFDFSPVGVAVALAGLVFLVLVGWRLLPLAGRRGEAEKAFEIEDYITEARVGEESKADGMTIAEFEDLTEAEVSVVGLIRNEDRRLVPTGFVRILAGDILVLRGDADALETAVAAGELELVGEEEQQDVPKLLRSKDVDLVEAVVSPGSTLIGRTPSSMRLRLMHGANLLALARQGHQIRDRLSEVQFRSGDVLMLQGPSEHMPDILATLQCLPLAERPLGIGRQRRLVFAGGLFMLAVALIVAGVLPVHIAFVAAAAGFVIADVIKPSEIYTSVDWPVIVLLAALFPVGAALDSTGGAALVADGILRLTEGLGVFWVLLVVLVGTMFLSDLINNNATAVLMAPIAVTVATRLNVNADPFLMAVAIGASCAFLTPIGHQSNTLVMEPGGYKFGDYWRVGLPLEVVIAAVAMPMILIVWPP
jgi:di/tricarboxylate transporter